MNIKYGLLNYLSINIGDEIQSIAANRFIPKTDYYVYRENIDGFKPNNLNEKVKLIMNSWWMWRPDHFPPSEFILPLFVSFHMFENERDSILSGGGLEYLKQYEPIGCRDVSTVNYLKSKGIDAYFSGCVTSCLLPNKSLKNSSKQYILCVSCPKEVVEEVKKRTCLDVYEMTPLMSPYLLGRDRFSVAKALLYFYHNAFLVVTKRMHATIPCLAFETPVLYLMTNGSLDERLTGYENMFVKLEEKEFLDNEKSYDVIILYQTLSTLKQFLMSSLRPAVVLLAMIQKQAYLRMIMIRRMTC